MQSSSLKALPDTCTWDRHVILLKVDENVVQPFVGSGKEFSIESMCQLHIAVCIIAVNVVITAQQRRPRVLVHWACACPCLDAPVESREGRLARPGGGRADLLCNCRTVEADVGVPARWKVLAVQSGTQIRAQWALLLRHRNLLRVEGASDHLPPVLRIPVGRNSSAR